LFMNNQLLCIYIGSNKKRGWTPVAGLPDGRYSLRKPAKNKENWSLQITYGKSRKPLLMDLRNLVQEEIKGYDDTPLYLSLGDSPEQLSEPAKQNISKVVAAISRGDKVYLTISSKLL